MIAVQQGQCSTGTADGVTGYGFVTPSRIPKESFFNPVAESIPQDQPMPSSLSNRVGSPFAYSVVLALACVTPALASAQAAPKKSYGGGLDFGYVTASGNTSTTTISLGETFGWTITPKATFAQRTRYIYGKSQHVLNANLLDIAAAVDYKLVDGLGVTAGGEFDRNTFAGIRRRFQETFGVVYKLTTAKHDSARFDGGILWSQQTNLEDTRENFTAYRAGMLLKHPFSATAFVQHAMEIIPNIKNSDDWRFNSETALVAALSKRFSTKVSYTIRYDNLPETGFETTDRILTVGLQFSY
ncbi:MAG TPA: DUF481 domain-containing protein [Gemmatimonadaceae bacterium]|nr:DUF481 domain-containing protein [Gemmatimonadaceae bacterium]